MQWLAIETSSPQISLAIGQDQAVLKEVSREGNASTLIEPLFQELAPDLATLDCVIIGKGPGSYNGLRVGYAFLKGLLCLDFKPVIEVPSSLNLAYQAMKSPGPHTSIVVLQNARREELFAAAFDPKTPSLQKVGEWLAPASHLEKLLPKPISTVVSYDLVQQEIPGIPVQNWLKLFPTASFAGHLAHSRNLPPLGSLSSLEPHYVRAPVPEPPRLFVAQ